VVDFRSQQKIQAGRHTLQQRRLSRRLARAQQTDRALVVAEPGILAGKEGLDAELQIVRQRDFRDRRIDRYLQLRPVEVAYRTLDDPISSWLE